MAIHSVQLESAAALAGPQGEAAPTSAARILLPILYSAEQAGLDVLGALASAGEEVSLLERLDEQVSTEKVAAVWEETAALSADPFFALRSAIHRPCLNAADYVLFASRNMREGIAELHAFFQRSQTNISCGLRKVESGTAILWGVPGFSHFPSRAGLEYSYGRLWSVFRAGIGKEFRPIEIHFPWDCAGPVGEIEALLTCRVRFSMPEGLFIVNDADIDRPFRRLATTLENARQRDIALGFEKSGPALDFAERVRLLIRSRMADGVVPTLEEAAEFLCVSRRTCQRQLSASGVTFVGLLDETRREIALRQIAAGCRNAQKLTEAVRFADVVTFYRAFRRWTGSGFSEA